MSQPPAHLPSARIKRRGLMLVISSPSGAGKSTIARNLLENDPGLSLSVSVTTRPRRGSEIEGVHYHFKSHREFERMRESEALLEWAEVHGNSIRKCR
jgi:guanylate kinase